ncbi:D-alanyl-D-alanine carboxypeptidase [Acinetobacter sp. 187]|uniref:D-alanyl-D-alanine carboxypeptidase family protein n=1 Tax=Acinetobacter lanii TaxID=2715163 RepID=UPI0014088DDF|nr:D-alanyl-D-alanine carboxypeptidase family protein [Acinetobacter lanii]NHC04830.1 D-alanyl-D-alanine carboxypeptidase [Acinetobacter lanii]
MKIFISFIVFLSVFVSTVVNAALLNIDPASVEAEAWTVLDAQSGQTIAEYNSHVQRAPASMTKMMVAYIAFKEIQAGRLKKEELLTATPVVNVVQWDESQMYLKPGEQITIDQLLAGLIVMSANDAAVSLAERISGSVPAFVARMNKEAKALGMNDTHFANPPGVTMDDHYSSAHDMALLGQAVTAQTPEYMQYSVLPNFSYKQHFHRATNLVLKVDPSVDGLKTGFTKAAGYNLTLTAHRPSGLAEMPERRIIVVVMGSKSAIKRAEIAHKLLNLAYTYTRDEVAIKDKQLIAELPVVQSTLKMFKVEAKQPQFMTTALYTPDALIQLNDFDETQQRLVQVDETGLLTPVEPLAQTQTHMDVQLKAQSLTAPLAKMVELAQVHVYQNNKLIQTFMIEDEVKLEESSWFERLITWFKNLLPFASDAQSQAKTYPLG